MVPWEEEKGEQRMAPVVLCPCPRRPSSWVLVRMALDMVEPPPPAWVPARRRTDERQRRIEPLDPKVRHVLIR